jgi:alkylhydroperoxidase family enzyme
MARVELPQGGGWERDRLWKLRPDIGLPAEAFSALIQERTILPPRVHEGARMRIADINGCIACQGARPHEAAVHRLDEAFYSGISDPERRGEYSESEQVAIEFAERFAAGAAAFDDAFWDRVHASFTDPEIVDLTLSCAKWLGMGRLNAVLELIPTCQMEVLPSAQLAAAPAG